MDLRSSELVTAAAPCTSPRRRNRATGQKPFMVIACINLPRHAGRSDWYGLSLTFIAGQLLYLQADGVVSMSLGDFRGFGAHQSPLIIAFSILPCLSSSLLQKKGAERRGSSKNKTTISNCHEDFHLTIIQRHGRCRPPYKILQGLLFIATRGAQFHIMCFHFQ